MVSRMQRKKREGKGTDLDDVPNEVRQLLVELDLLLILLYLLLEGFQVEVRPMQLILHPTPTDSGIRLGRTDKNGVNHKTLHSRKKNQLGFQTLRIRISLSRRREALMMSSVLMEESWSSSKLGSSAIAVAMDWG